MALKTPFRGVVIRDLYLYIYLGFALSVSFDITEASRRISRISFASSIQRANSSMGNIPERMRYMNTASLQGSGHSLERGIKVSKASFGKAPRERSLSQLSRESDVSFYSCGSLLDEIGMNQRYDSLMLVIDAVEFLRSFVHTRGLTKISLLPSILFQLSFGICIAYV